MDPTVTGMAPREEPLLALDLSGDVWPTQDVRDDGTDDALREIVLP